MIILSNAADELSERKMKGEKLERVRRRYFEELCWKGKQRNGKLSVGTTVLYCVFVCSEEENISNSGITCLLCS